MASWVAKIAYLVRSLSRDALGVRKIGMAILVGGKTIFGEDIWVATVVWRFLNTRLAITRGSAGICGRQLRSGGRGYVVVKLCWGG